MTRTYCDRCGAEIPDVFKDATSVSVYLPTEDLVLCERCGQALRAWVRASTDQSVPHWRPAEEEPPADENLVGIVSGRHHGIIWDHALAVFQWDPDLHEPILDGYEEAEGIVLHWWMDPPDPEEGRRGGGDHA